jgi:hypothetical protein
MLSIGGAGNGHQMEWSGEGYLEVSGDGGGGTQQIEQRKQTDGMVGGIEGRITGEIDQKTKIKTDLYVMEITSCAPSEQICNLSFHEAIDDIYAYAHTAFTGCKYVEIPLYNWENTWLIHDKVYTNIVNTHVMPQVAKPFSN